MAKGHKVFSEKKAGKLDSFFRKIIHNPSRILKGHIKPGMTVLDIGCGSGFFAIQAAKMVGSQGKVIAADLQAGMLKRLKERIQGGPLESRIVLHRTRKDSIGINTKTDLALAFYVVHEVPDIHSFLKELNSIMKPGSELLLVEPSHHVSEEEFLETLQTAKEAAFAIERRSKIPFSRAAVLRK